MRRLAHSFLCALEIFSEFCNPVLYAVHGRCLTHSCTTVGFVCGFDVGVACRVAYDRDMKVMNAATFTLQREDHTIGNVLRM